MKDLDGEVEALRANSECDAIADAYEDQLTCIAGYSCGELKDIGFRTCGYDFTAVLQQEAETTGGKCAL